jgi:hypothetical protein
MAQADDLYVRTDWLIRELRAAGIPVAADRLSHLLHEVAWTTSSELIGELGQALLVIQREHASALPAGVARALGEAIAGARRVWPDLREPEVAPPCPGCGEANARVEIHSAGQLRQVLRSIRALVESGSLRVLPHAHASPGEPQFMVLPLEGPWPDVLNYRFKCERCGMHFSLSAETYHGQGGEWKPVP